MVANVCFFFVWRTWWSGRARARLPINKHLNARGVNQVAASFRLAWWTSARSLPTKLRRELQCNYTVCVAAQRGEERKVQQSPLAAAKSAPQIIIKLHENHRQQPCVEQKSHFHFFFFSLFGFSVSFPQSQFMQLFGALLSSSHLLPSFFSLSLASFLHFSFCSIHKPQWICNKCFFSRSNIWFTNEIS